MKDTEKHKQLLTKLRTLNFVRKSICRDIINMSNKSPEFKSMRTRLYNLVIYSAKIKIKLCQIEIMWAKDFKEMIA